MASTGVQAWQAWQTLGQGRCSTHNGCPHLCSYTLIHTHIYLHVARFAFLKLNRIAYAMSLGKTASIGGLIAFGTTTSLFAKIGEDAGAPWSLDQIHSVHPR